MTLPNAHSGVKKIFIAEILQIIGSIVAIVGLTSILGAAGVYSVTGDANDVVGVAAVGGIFTLLAAALAILALVLNLVGLRQASKDEPDRMGKAFMFAIITLILSVIVSLCQSMHWGAAGFFSTLSSISQLCMIIFTIMGVSEVTQNIARQDVADMGPVIITIEVIAIVAAIIAGIVGNVIGGVAAIISLVLMIVSYFVFLVFLGRATSALAKG